MVFPPAMGIFSRTKHKLPKFPSTVIPAFRRACELLSPAQALELKAAVDENLNGIEQAKGKNPCLNLTLAREIAAACHYLLDSYEKYSPAQRAQIVGAVRYFAVHDDPFPDMMFATGLDDDAQIVNHVLEALGVEDRFVNIPQQ